MRNKRSSTTTWSWQPSLCCSTTTSLHFRMKSHIYGQVQSMCLRFYSLSPGIWGVSWSSHVQQCYLSSWRQRCLQYAHCRLALLFVNQALVCMLFILRTYALYGKSIRLLTFLLFTSIALASVVAWSLVGQQGTSAVTLPGCHVVYNTRTAIQIAVAYEALCIFDTLIFGLTAYKTFKVGIRCHSKPNLVVVLLRDGAIYFAIVAIANLANILLLYLAPELLKDGLSAFSMCIAVTMVSRLMLNLHSSAGTGIFSPHRQQFTSDPDGAMFTSHLIGPGQGWDLPNELD
ncbi:hypothetical protein EDC04DRAFT_1993831 [Pisolithus marmoratus]|nr:hypothetical protein EDC04DRAFT_1993831 [Pisolithus marmoratus]